MVAIRRGRVRRDSNIAAALLTARKVRPEHLLTLSITTLHLVQRRGWAREHRRGNYAALAMVAECAWRLSQAIDWL